MNSRRPPSGLTPQFLLPQQRRVLQQAQEVWKGFGCKAMKGTVLPRRHQTATPAPQDALDPLGYTQGN